MNVNVKNKRQWIYGYLFIAPVFIGLVIFYIYPFIKNILNSFCSINNFNAAKYRC